MGNKKSNNTNNNKFQNNADTKTIKSSTTTSNVLTIPLMPYHAVAERRRRQRQRKLLENDIDIDLYNEEDLNEQLKDQHRRQQQQQQQQRRHRHRQRNQQMNRRSSYKNKELYNTAEQISGLYEGIGTHYIDIWCGTPVPQRQTVIVDTGSGITAFPCSTCTNNCGVPNYHINLLYNESLSSSFHKVSCSNCLLGECNTNMYDYNNNNNNEKEKKIDKNDNDTYCSMGMSYQEGSSWSAYEAIDTCYIGGLHHTSTVSTTTNSIPKTTTSTTSKYDTITTSVNNAIQHSYSLYFGCQTSVTGLFQTQLADGIMGMNIDIGSFWYQMFLSQQIQSQSFSLCFSTHFYNYTTSTDNIDNDDNDDNDDDVSSSGAMSLGGTDPRLHSTPMFYTEPLRNRQNDDNVNDDDEDMLEEAFYHVSIKNVYLRANSNLNATTTSTSNNNIIKVDISNTNLVKKNSYNITTSIIVDSGTTDTYFSKSFGKVFNIVWKEITNTDYTTNPISLSYNEIIESMPTILLQLHGSIEINKKITKQYQKQQQQQQKKNQHQQSQSTVIATMPPGLAGDIDPYNPYDVIIEIQPSNYFVYNEQYKKYESRFMIDNDDDDSIVLGANTMLGHDVYFDIDNTRIGWAQSTCNYTELIIIQQQQLDQRQISSSLSVICTTKQQCQLLVFVVGTVMSILLLLLLILVLIIRKQKNTSNIEYEIVPDGTHELEMAEHKILLQSNDNNSDNDDDNDE